MGKNESPQKPYNVKNRPVNTVVKTCVLCTMIMLYCCNSTFVDEHSYGYAYSQSIQHYITTTDIYLLVYALSACLTIIIIIGFEIVTLRRILFDMIKPFLRYFDFIDKTDQIMMIFFRILGTIIICLYLIVVLLPDLFIGKQYSSAVKETIKNLEHNKYVTTIVGDDLISRVKEEIQLTRVSLDKDIIIEFFVGLLIIVVYVLLFYLLTSRVNSTCSVLRKIVFFTFLPVAVFNNIFGFLLTEDYYDERNKLITTEFLKRIFSAKKEKTCFLVESFVEILFSCYGYIIVLLSFSYVYIATILYPTIEYKEFSHMYEGDVVEGVWRVFVTTCLLMTWYAIAKVVFCVLEKPEDIFIWTKKVKELYKSNKDLQENHAALQNEYDIIVKNDKEWMTLFLHFLGNSSSILHVHMDEYSDGDSIPYDKIQPEIVNLEKILYKCYSLADVLASREISKDKVVSASFLKEFKNSVDIRPYVSKGRISLNMHGHENDDFITDSKKVQSIIKIILDNALQHALDNTVIDIDYSIDGEKHVLTISNIIDPSKEDEITRRIRFIDSFWKNREYPPSQEKLCIGLILAKINAQNMKAEFTYKLENHLRFVTRLAI